MADETVAPDPTPEPEPSGDLSDQQLESMLNALRDQTIEPPADAPIEAPAEEAAAETVEAQPETEPESEPAPSTEDTLEDIRLSLKEESLRREKLEAQLAHEKLMREQGNTRAGTYKKLATDLLRDGRTPPADDPEYSEDDSPVGRELQTMQHELASLREEANTRASRETLQDFVNATPDLATDTEESRRLFEEMKPHVHAARREHSDLLDSGNPRLVRETTKLILKTAYIEAKTARLATEKASAVERRAAQFAALGKAKSASAISGSGAAAPARPKTKTPQEMTADEADAALRAMTR